MLTLVLLSFLTLPSIDLKLEKVYQVETSRGERFDLSGLLFLSEKSKAFYHLEAFEVLAVNDRSSWIYRGRFDKDKLKLEPWLRVQNQWGARHDFEDLATDGEKIYILNEVDGAVLEIQQDFSLRIHLLKTELGKYAFTDWFGAEGMIFLDGFWLFREMQPLAAVHIKNQQVKILPGPAGGDQTSARYYKSHFYILDRSSRCIWRSKTYGSEKRECLSFAKYVDEDSYYRYEVRDAAGKLHPEWSTAEALDIYQGKYWVGLDNNGEALTRDPNFKAAVILVLE